MKKIAFLLVIFCSLGVFSQDNETTSGYDEIILDGKTAYMSIKTGKIVTEIPNGVSNNDATTANTSNLETHVVENGDTFYSISRKYGISITKLKKLNANIDFSNLKVNQKINTNNTVAVLAPNEYVVENGNTLYAISQMFSISVDDLKRLNNLKTTVISVGQKLIIK